ncbi:MAG: galactitol-1-phosphate 5-dehydrogenase [Lachnospiraceae bacterium]|nr:galactitol-1-phosphate 5-dehydrogenase [Lachnospiraceae bacterium]
MKAWVLHGIGDIQFEEVKEPRPAEGEVIVKVKSAGICGSDIPRIYQTGTYHFPTIPGHEFSGMVADVGIGVKPEWKNKRVGVFPLIPCRECASCKKAQYEMCGSYGYLGSRQDGGFAEYVAVPEWNLIELPESVSFVEAAMMEPMSVAVHAMRRAQPDKDSVCVICGLGTIGMLLLAFLKDAGVQNIFVICNKDFQRRTAAKFGLQPECCCDSRTENVSEWIMEHTQNRGADLFFECVGKNETVSQAVSWTAPAGKVIFVGNPASDMVFQKAVYWKILRNQLTVLGTWNSSFTHSMEDDWHYMMERLQNRRICPEELVTHRFPLERLSDGLNLMRNKTEESGKVIIVWKR